MSNVLVDPSIQPDTLTQQQIQQLMQAGISMDKIKLLQGRMKKHSATPIGGMVGDRYVSNPLAIVENAVNQYQDDKHNEGLQAQQDSALQGIPNARAIYAQAMLADALRKQSNLSPEEALQ